MASRRRGKKRKCCKPEEFVWVRNLPGVPKLVMWPGKLLPNGSIYFKGDHAELRVKAEDVSPLKASELWDNSLKFESVLQDRKKLGTLKQFKSDISWVQAQLDICKKPKPEGDADLEIANGKSEGESTTVAADCEIPTVPCETDDADCEIADGKSEGESNTIRSTADCKIPTGPCETDDADCEIADGKSEGESNTIRSTADCEIPTVPCETDDADCEIADGKSEGESNTIRSTADCEIPTVPCETDDVDCEIADGKSEGESNTIRSTADCEIPTVPCETDDADCEIADGKSEGESNTIRSTADCEIPTVPCETDDADCEIADGKSEGESNTIRSTADCEIPTVPCETDDADCEIADGKSEGESNTITADCEIPTVPCETDDADCEIADGKSEGESNTIRSTADCEIPTVPCETDDADCEIADGKSEGESNTIRSTADCEIPTVPCETDDADCEIADGKSEGESTTVAADCEIPTVPCETDDADCEIADGKSEGESNTITADCEIQTISYEHSGSESDIVIQVTVKERDELSVESDIEYVPDSEESDDEADSTELPKFINFINQEMATKNQEEQGHLPEQKSQSKPSERKLKLKESEIDRDCKYKDIYIKKYLKSNKGRTGLKKDDRPYDTVHACLFCGNLFSHLQEHLERKHHNKEEVQQIIKLKKEMADADEQEPFKKELKRLQDCIRYSGDHKHNLLVKEHKEGELLIQRKSKDDFIFEDYGPCPGCLQWIKLESSVRLHQSNCPKTEDPKRLGKRNLIVQAKQLIGSSNASELLCKEVLPKMRMDDVGRCAQDDVLINSLGDVWLSKSYGHGLRRGKDSSFHMRLAAKLLLKCRSELNSPHLDMDELLVMKNFDKIVDTALDMCGKNEHDELLHPSTANKMGFDLTRMIALKYGKCIKKKDASGKEEADGLLKLMKIHWATKVSTRTNYLIRERHFDKRRKLPHPDDIEKVATKLFTTLAQYNYQDKDQYVVIARTVLVRLMVYNRRRSGEIEELKMTTFLNRSKAVDDVEQSLLGELSSTERYLIKNQELMWIRGKRGKRVPVLIPSDATEALNYVVDPEVRLLAGLKETNKYMFATRGDGVISASESLKALGSDMELIHPERLSSTGYRAYMATIAQCLGLEDHQIQWLCTHLGHTEDVHKTHYRFALDGIERIQLGKLLMLQDKNLLSKYRNTRLEDIQFEDIIFSGQDKADGSEGHEEDGGEKEFDSMEMAGMAEPDGIAEMDAEMGGITEKGPLASTKRKHVPSAARVRWTDQEIEEIKLYASAYIAKKKTPSRKVCQTYITQSREAGGQLHRRSAAHIVKKISAINVKARKTE